MGNLSCCLRKRNEPPKKANNKQYASQPVKFILI